jgi:3-oxoacid CoA-transferase
MVTSAKCTIVEVEELCPLGALKPDDIHTPGVFVDYVFVGEKYDKKFEKINHDPAFSKAKPSLSKDHSLREKIIKRVVKEVRNGMYVNLGIGIPTLLPSYLPKDIVIELQSENGVLGVGNYPKPGEEDPDLINAGKETVTLIPGSSIFSSS